MDIFGRPIDLPKADHNDLGKFAYLLAFLFLNFLFIYLFWWASGLNSGLRVCKVRHCMLEPHL
jgi:uncharacterized RDD family membrane protein YckC